MKNFKALLYSYIFYSISAFGISLSIKANVGVSSFNSLNLALSQVSDIKIGTVTMIINSLFLLTYMYMTSFEVKSKYALQLFSIVVFGSLINFFTYYVLRDFNITNYSLRILLIVVGTIISGLSVGMIISYAKITFPIESFCLELAEKKSISFAKVRYSIDIFSIIISTIISVSFALPFYVREGTIISLILFTASMNLSKSVYAKKHINILTYKSYN